MTNRQRYQITLFLPDDASAIIEGVRRLVDPVQASLIAAHVTLVRDDELPLLTAEEFSGRLMRAKGQSSPLQLTFGPPVPSVDHGILMPCTSGIAAFQSLRCVMFPEMRAKQLNPHITLAHPRNPKAPGNSIENTAPLNHGLTIVFRRMTLIRQTDQQPWDIVRTLNLD